MLHHDRERKDAVPRNDVENMLDYMWTGFGLHPENFKPVARDFAGSGCRGDGNHLRCWKRHGRNRMGMGHMAKSRIPAPRWRGAGIAGHQNFAETSIPIVRGVTTSIWVIVVSEKG